MSGEESVFLFVLAGLPLTLLVTAVAMLVGSTLAVAFLTLRVSENPVIQLVGKVLLDVVRSVPPVVLLFMLAFGIKIGGVPLEPLVAGIAGMSLIAAANIAEIYRGGIQAIPPSQLEASAALGLTRRQTIFGIALPQVVGNIMPSYSTYAIGLIKDSSIISTIGVADLMFTTSSWAQSHVTQMLPAFGLAAAIYLAISLPTAYLTRHIDARAEPLRSIG